MIFVSFYSVSFKSTKRSRLSVFKTGHIGSSKTELMCQPKNCNFQSFWRVSVPRFSDTSNISVRTQETDTSFKCELYSLTTLPWSGKKICYLYSIKLLHLPDKKPNFLQFSFSSQILFPFITFVSMVCSSFNNLQP